MQSAKNLQTSGTDTSESSFVPYFGVI